VDLVSLSDSSDCFVTTLLWPEAPFVPLITKFVVFWLFRGSLTPLTHIGNPPTSFFILSTKTHTNSHTYCATSTPFAFTCVAISRKPWQLSQHQRIMSSLQNDKPSLARARLLVDDSIPTHTSKLTSFRGADQSMSSGQRQASPTITPDAESCPALTSESSLPNQGPTGLKPPLERCRPLGLFDTVVAKAYLESLSRTVPYQTRDGCGRRTNASDCSADIPDDGYSTHCGVSHRSSSARASQSTFQPTRHAGHGRSGVSQESVNPRDEVAPSEATPMVFMDGVTGKLSEKNGWRIAGSLSRSVFGGNG
jgi:hypothetical protein